MNAGAWVAVAAVLLALSFVLYRHLTDGRFTSAPAAPLVEEARQRRLETRAPNPPLVEEARQRRLETPAAAAPNLLADTPWQGDLGERATLLQFSSAFCAPCRATRRILGDLADQTDGVAHLEVDAEKHLDLVRRLHVLRTPTTVILDSHGVEVGRAAGAPSPAQVTRSLRAAGLT